jgi:hypothetical protein
MAILEAVGGAVVGAGFGSLATYVFQNNQKRKENKKIETAIKIEVKRNGKKLKSFWEVVDQNPTKYDLDNRLFEDIWLDKKVKILRCFDKDVPEWSIRIWEGNTAGAALALKEIKFNQVYQFYEKLNAISMTYLQLARIDPGELFSDERNELWPKIVSLIDDTLALEKSIIED